MWCLIRAAFYSRLFCKAWVGNREYVIKQYVISFGGGHVMKTRNNFNNLIVFSLFVLTVLFLGGCVTAKQKLLDAGMQPLSNSDLQSLFAEQKNATFTNQKSSGTVKYFPDGRQEATWQGGSGGGTFYIKDGEFCSKMDFRKGEVKCTTWFKVDEKTYELIRADGSKDATLIFQ